LPWKQGVIAAHEKGCESVRNLAQRAQASIKPIRVKERAVGFGEADALDPFDVVNVMEAVR